MEAAGSFWRPTEAGPCKRIESKMHAKPQIRANSSPASLAIPACNLTYTDAHNFGEHDEIGAPNFHVK